MIQLGAAALAKLVTAFVLFTVSGLALSPANPIPQNLTTATRADTSQCGNVYPDSDRCTNPAAVVSCEVKCNADRTQVTGISCEPCPTNEDDAEESRGESGCPRGAIPGCGNGLAKNGDSCTCTAQDGSFTGRQSCKGPEGSASWGVCERTDGENPPPQPSPTRFQPPTSPSPALGSNGWPSGKDCFYIAGGGECATANFKDCRAAAGKMCRCTENITTIVVNGQERRYGTANPNGEPGCGAENVCAQNPQGGEFFAPGCGNWITCPRTWEPTIQPSPTPQTCQKRYVGSYCDENLCKYVRSYRDSCTGDQLPFEPTDQNCCVIPGEPTPRQPEEPPITPGEVPVCNGLEVIYTDPQGNERTQISTDYRTEIKVKPGSPVTFNRLRLTNGQFTNGFAWMYAITCLEKGTCTVPQLQEQARAQGYPVALPRTVTSSTTPGEVGQTNGVVERTDEQGVICAVRIRSEGVDRPTPTPPRIATPTPVGPTSPPPSQPPATVPPGQPSPTTPPPTVPPQQEPTTTPTITLTPSPVPQTCGLTPCDDATRPCGNGLICLETSNGSKYCSRPEYQQTCYANPSEQSCCAAPNRKLCGASQCDDILAPCENGLECIETSVGVKYCSMPMYSESCSANPSQPTCCTAPTATPSPTPRPVTCGERCDDSSVRCANGLVCVNTSNGRYCSMPNFQSACASNPNQTTCCTEASPTPQPTFTPQPTYTPQPTLPPQVAPPQQQIIRQQQAPPPNRVVQQVTVFIQPTYVPQAPPPTYTPLPTFTPLPTQPPQPSFTPPPIPVAGNPIPWVVVGTPVLLMLLGMFL